MTFKNQQITRQFLLLTMPLSSENRQAFNTLIATLPRYVGLNSLWYKRLSFALVTDFP